MPLETTPSLHSPAAIPPRLSGNVDDGPMVKIGARQIGGHAAPFLIDVVRHRRRVGVDTHQRKRLRLVRHLAPAKVGIAVSRKRDVVFRGDPREGVLGRNRLAVAEAFALESQNVFLLLAFNVGKTGDATIDVGAGSYPTTGSSRSAGSGDVEVGIVAPRRRYGYKTQRT